MSELLLRPEAVFLWAGGHDARSVVADPLFVDAAHSDYTLRDGSPALARGFERLRLEAAGPDWEAPEAAAPPQSAAGLDEKTALN